MQLVKPGKYIRVPVVGVLILYVPESRAAACGPEVCQEVPRFQVSVLAVET